MCSEQVLDWGPIFFEKNDGSYFDTNNPRKDFLNLLIKKTRAHGHMLTFEEARDDPDMIKPNSYAFYFGSFTMAAEIAWSEVRREIGEGVKDLVKTEDGRGKRYTIVDVRDALLNFYKKTGKLPTQSDARRNNMLPSWTILVKHLGPKSGWQKIVDNVEPVSIPYQEGNQSKSFDESVAVITDACEAEDFSTEEKVIGDFCVKDESTETSSSSEDEQIKVETSEQKDNESAAIEMKITLPDREKPILITLKV